MRAIVLASTALVLIATSAFAYDPVADTRKIMAATVTTKSIQTEYLTGKRDGTPAFKRVQSAYVAIRAADAPVHHPEPLPSGDVLSPTLKGRVPIASKFDPKLGMEPRAIPTKLYGEGLRPRADGWSPVGQDGAFRFTAGGDGPLTYDDPVAFAKINNGAHLHLFFCGVNIDENSTYESVRANPSSNCSNPTYPLNPSGYWLPAFLVGNEARRPEYISVYYKGCSALANSACAENNPQRRGIKTDFPHGIVLIGGWDVQKPNGADGIANNADDAPGSSFYCTGGTGAHFTNLSDLFASGCKAGDLLVWDLIFGDCWDGKRLDSANHRDHLVFGSYGAWGYYRCPTTHPYSIPQPQFKAALTVTADMYAIENGQVVSKLYLASDAMKPEGKPGTSGHGDWMPAWDPTAQDFFHRGCIDKGLDCVQGDFGNGWGMKNAAPSYGFDLLNDRSAIPAR